MNTLDIQTQIAAVTVFTDRSLVTRQGRVALQTGAQQLILNGLPLGLDVESLRATGRGEVAVKLLGVEARERTQPKAVNPSTREIQDELDVVTDEGRAIGERDSVWLQRMETMRQLAEKSANRYAEALATGKTNVGELTQLLDFIAAQQNEVNAQRQVLELQKRENAARQMALTSRLKQLQNSKPTTERVVAILIEAASEGPWELEFSYIVKGASWSPIYDARVQLQPTNAGLNGKLTLTYAALVTQKSGEDWKDVAFTLSTARPGIGTLPPKLAPLFVDVHHPLTNRGVSASAALGGGPSDKYDDDVAAMLSGLSPLESTSGMELAYGSSASSPLPIEAQQVVANTESGGATVTFTLPHTLNVPSDGQPHRATIAVQEFPIQLDYAAIPCQASLAFLRAKATNNSVLSLLEGPVSIFRDGTFVGKAKLEATAPNGELTLFLGPDEGVRAVREMTAREVDKNFIGSSRRLHFAYQIELHNHKNHPARLNVQDQIPVSRSEQIKVKLRGAQPEATQSELGVLDWNLTLAPGEKRVIRFDYGVETPRDVRIVGLRD